jgi:predicted HTH domain antitoxin
MGTISARVPDELEAELEAYLEEERLDRSTAIRKLLSESLEDWRIDHALGQLEQGELTVSRAAEIAGIDVWELVTHARDRDITWVDRDHVERDLEEL